MLYDICAKSQETESVDALVNAECDRHDNRGSAKKFNFSLGAGASDLRGGAYMYAYIAPEQHFGVQLIFSASAMVIHGLHLS